MIHRLRLGDGGCTYGNRWVRTRNGALEDAAERQLFGGWGYRPVEGGPPVELDGAANTNLVLHGRRLLALQESSPPIEIDVDDLDTVGRLGLEGGLSRTFTAHPKPDPAATSPVMGIGRPSPDTDT
jgi:carotenoid cleavage dioxygenase